MTYREAFTALIQTLGQLYSDQASIRRIIIQVNLPIEQILFSGRADNTWADMLYKARRHNQVEDIFAVVLGEYPAVPELNTAVAGYREVVARGDVPPPSLRRCDFYAHVSLPPNFVARPALLSEVRDTLLATPTMALTSAIPMDALHGMGGIGKSVVARALCDDAEVQGVFSDGILWATVGQTPELIPRLREWVEELGGIIPQTAPTINQLKQNLAELLTDRACLLILDDVWHRTDAEPFLVGGPRCRLLLTTRDSEVARGLGAGVHAVPAMDPDEAVDLLELWAGGALHHADEASKRQIVRRLGYLPLAIKLAGSQLQRKSPERWLAGFDATQLQEPRIETVHDSLARTFALSLDELTPEVRRLYVALAIFHEDEATPMPGIGKLWTGLAGYNEEQTVDLVQDLAARALLQVTDSGPEGTPAAVTIHDLLRDFMGAELGEAGRLAAHRSLLDAYRRTQVGAGWATAPDDGYLYDHLVYHLEQLSDHEASAVSELQSLFTNDAWLQVRVSRAGYRYNGYVADLDVAWQRGHRDTLGQIEAGTEPAAFVECVRYALVRTSINSLLGNYQPTLVARAVETDLWSAQRALDIALTVPDPQARFNMLTTILSIEGLPREVHKSAMQARWPAASAIWSESHRVEALTALAPHLPAEHKAPALAEGLAAAQEIENEWVRSKALAHLAPLLSGELLKQGLNIAQDIENEIPRSLAVAVLVLRGSEESPAHQLMKAQVIEKPSILNILASINLYLGRKDRAEIWASVLAAARRIDDLSGILEELLTQGMYLSGEDKEQVLDQMLLCTLAIENEAHWLMEMTAATVSDLSEEEAEAVVQAWATPQTDQGEWLHTETLSHLSGEVLEHTLTAARHITDETFCVQALVALAPYLLGEDKVQALTQALAAVQTVKNESLNAKMLTSLVPHLSEEEKTQVLDQALTTAQMIRGDWSRAQALIALAAHFSGEKKIQILTQALTATQMIKCDGLRVLTLVQFLEEDERQELTQVLAMVQVIEDEGWRSLALAALAPYLSGDEKTPLLAQALAAAQAITDEVLRTRALVALAPHLPSEDKAKVLARALTTAVTVKEPGLRTKMLVALAPHLSEELLAPGIYAARVIEDEYYQAQALAAFLPSVQDDKSLLTEIRLCMARLLWNNMRFERREALLSLCNTKLLHPPIFNTTTLSRIAADIIEICRHWTWL